MLFYFKIQNKVCCRLRPQIGDFKMKAIDWRFVVVVQIRVPVTFLSIIRKYFLLARVPLNTKHNKLGHRTDSFMLTKQTDDR